MQVDEGLRVAFAALRAPGDDASKLSILSALRINLLNDAAKFPLLKHLMPFICELEAATSTSVRIFVLDCFQRLLFVEPKLHVRALLPAFVRIATAALSNRSAAERPLLNNVGLALINLMPIIFQVIGDVPRDLPWTDEWAALWNPFIALVFEYLQLAFNPSDVPESVRVHAVQLCEAVILSFSSAKLGLNQSSAIAPPTPCTRISTDLLPPSHPALDPVKLNIEADKLLEKMLASLDFSNICDVSDSLSTTEPQTWWSCTSIGVALRVLDVLATHRGDGYLQLIAPRFIRLQANPPTSLPHAHLKRFRHALKISLLNLLKWRPASLLKVNDTMSIADQAYDALGQMGFQDDANMARRVAAKASQVVQQQPTAQRAEEPAYAGIAPVSAERASNQQLRELLAQLPSKMSAPAIAHLVMHCMDEQHFSAARAQTLPTAMYPPINLGLLPPLPFHIAPHSAPFATVATSSGINPPGSSIGVPPTGSRLSLRPADCSSQLVQALSLLEFCTRRRQFPSAPPIQWTTSLDECVKWDAAERQAAAQSAAQAAAAAKRAAQAAPLVLSVPTLKPEQCRVAARQAFARMLTNKTEIEVAHEGADKLLLRAAYLSKLAGLTVSSDDNAEVEDANASTSRGIVSACAIPGVHTQLQAYLQDNAATAPRFETALSMLYMLFASENQPSSSAPEERYADYDRALLAMCEAWEKRMPALAGSDLLLRLLREIPRVPSTIFPLLQRYCGDANRLRNVLRILFDIIQFRPLVREQAFELLLDLCSDEREDARKWGVQTVVNKCLPLSAHFADAIVARAQQSLQHLLSEPLPVVSTVEELVAAELAPPQVVSSDAATAMAAVSAAFGLSTPTAAADTSKDGQADADAGGDDDDADEFGAALAATEDSSVAGVVAEVDVVVKPEPAKARGGVSLATLESAKIRAAAEESAKKRVQEEVVARERYIRRYLVLYLAVCSKQHSLFAALLQFFADASVPVRKVIHSQAPNWLKSSFSTTSTDILTALEQCPPGSELFALQTISVLCDGVQTSAIPSQLMRAARRLYQQDNNSRFLIPILGALSRDEALAIVPRLLLLPSPQIIDAFRRLVGLRVDGAAADATAPLNPAQLVVALHGIDTQREQVPLKMVLEAITLCFNQRTALGISQDVLARALQQMVEQARLPLLLLRSMIQTLKIFPRLLSFVFGTLLPRLLMRRIWEVDAGASIEIWKGFVKICEENSGPLAFNVLLQLPPDRLAQVAVESAKIGNDMRAWVISQQAQHIRRPYLLALGLDVVGQETEEWTETEQRVRDEPEAEDQPQAKRAKH